MKNPYELLQVGRDASDAEIKRQYRKLAKKYHPDLNPDDEKAEERFQELGEAYSILSDPEKRSLYDRYGEAAFEQGGMGYSPGGFDFTDLFSDLFGGFSGFSGRAQQESGYEDGGDITVTVLIDFKEAVFGVEKEVQIRRNINCRTCSGTGMTEKSKKVDCPTCKGQGYIREETHSAFGRIIQNRTCPTCKGKGYHIENPCKTCKGEGREYVNEKLKVKIPAGIDNGMVIPIRERGHEGRNGGRTGTLYVQVGVREHEVFKRKGKDVYYEMPITFLQAALGDTLEVPGLYGTLTHELKPGTQTGTTFTKKGEGMADVHGGRKGDLHVTVRVVTPTKLNDRQKELLREFGEASGEEVKEDKKNFFNKIKDFFD